MTTMKQGRPVECPVKTRFLGTLGPEPSLAFGSFAQAGEAQSLNAPDDAACPHNPFVSLSAFCLEW